MKQQISFTIPVKGFIHRPDKNPLGYTRTTQRGKFCDKAILYERWKDYVWECCEPMKMNELPAKNQKIKLDMKIFYKNDAKADASNVFKGVEDALADKTVKSGGFKTKTPRIYKNDNYCMGSFDFDYDKENPRVEVGISW